MRWHDSNTRLSHQAIFIISVPFFFQLLLILTVLCLARAGDNQLREESNTRHILAQCSELTASVVKSASAMSFFLLGGADPRAANHELQMRNDSISQNLEQLNSLLNTAAERQRFEQLKIVTNELKSIFKASGAHDEMELVSVGQAKRVQPLIFKIENSIQSLSVIEQQHLDQAHAKYLQVQGLIQMTCWASLAVSLLIAAALLSYFDRSVTARMKTLKSNADRVVSGESLLPKLDGNDEFAQVDGSFHNLAQELDKATIRRKELLQMVAHDLRSPLSAILLALQFLLAGKRGEVSSAVKSELSRARDGAEGLIKLINDLLKLEAFESDTLSLDKRRTSLAFLLVKAVESVQPLASNKSITIDCPEQGPLVYVDPDRLTQVFVNLLSNAIKFSDAGQSIEVEILSTTRDVDGHFESWAEISVIDHGRGIPANKIDQLFQRFTQVQSDDKKHGTGLGLAICKELVEAHGGRIGCESELNAGSRFWIKILACD